MSNTEELIERLKADPYYDRKPLDYGLMHEAASALQSLKEENEATTKELDWWQSRCAEQAGELTKAESDLISTQALAVRLERQLEEARRALGMARDLIEGEFREHNPESGEYIDVHARKEWNAICAVLSGLASATPAAPLGKDQSAKEASPYVVPPEVTE